ncbi:MAG: hypothetical protein NC180_07790 [Muribaculaceae bacterium]|nr:hypothetical protein [Roseburia sp.]MCM1430176.1 hypothetical protein [Muribaculaceae bacterium]MCM1493106.1 hypothetical protein [Muribaculaceae bacterium]
MIKKNLYTILMWSVDCIPVLLLYWIAFLLYEDPVDSWLGRLLPVGILVSNTFLIIVGIMEIKRAVSGKTDKLRQKKVILLSNTVLILAIILSLTLCSGNTGGRLFGFLGEFVLCVWALFVEGPTFLVAIVLYFDAYIEARKKCEGRG